MSYFTQQFENEKIRIASCLNALKFENNKVEPVHIIVTSVYNSSDFTKGECIKIYDVSGNINLTINKDELLKAIQQSLVHGKVAEL